MSLRSRLATWWQAVRRQSDVDAQVHEELQFHIESYAEDLMRLGVPRERAMRRARAEIGSVAAVRERSRQAWGTRWFDEMRGDVQFALRMLGKSPGFAAVAVGSLALGIGANTVIFTAAQHMLLDRLDVAHPDQLRLLAWSVGQNSVVTDMWGEFDNAPGGGQRSTSFSYPVYEALRKENHSLADICAFKPFGRMTVMVKGEAQPAHAEMVSGNYYSTMEVKPQLGRGIQEADDGAVGSGPVVTISDRFWTRAFARSRDVIGKTVLVNAKPMTVVGVNPPGFTGAFSAQNGPDIFLPFSMQPIVAPMETGPGEPGSLLEDRTLWWVLMMGRVKPDVGDPTAQAELNVALSAAVRATMTVKKDSGVPELQLNDGSRGQNPAFDEMAKPVTVLMSLAGLVLLLACANLANLLLARAGARQREMSVRLALGAARRRILRQMMTESLLLAALGGAAGLLLAWAVRNALPGLLSNGWEPPMFSARFSWPIFAFAAAISVLTGLIFGLAPGWQATRVQVSSGLKDSGQTITHRRRGLAGKSIVVAQVALSMLLVVGAGLFVQTLVRLGRAPLGFRSHNLLLFSVELPQTRFPGTASLPVLRQIEQKLAAVPGVQAATLTREALISGSVSMYTVVPEGQQKKAGKQGALMNDVGQDFFQTFGIPIVAGRGFGAGDTLTSRKVAVANQLFAKKFFPGLNPIGRTFDAGWDHPLVLEIVGVSGDAKYDQVRKAAEATFYTPYLQENTGVQEATFAVSTRLSGSALLPSLRDAVRSVDANLPIEDVRTQDAQIAASMQQERIFADLTGGFGALALLLACIGIYGIMAYAVSQRTNEIGIRMALGAQPARVLRMVFREAWWIAAIGVGTGLGGALALGRLIGAMLYGLKPWDPATLGGAAALLIAVALGASWIPARRAAGVDPMRALRHE
ncbi:MAG TPA: ABC transporter permease [Acidobacteriaceae bacterium]